MKHLKRVTFVIIALITFLFVAGCNSAPESTATSGASTGKVAPDFTLTDMAGNEVSLSQFKGQVVVVNFWATWCPPCREEMPSMERLYREYQDKGLVMLAVNVEADGRDRVVKFLEKSPHSFPILMDDKNVATKLFGVFRYPESFLIDRNGLIVEKIIGGRDWMSASILDKVKPLLAK